MPSKNDTIIQASESLTFFDLRRQILLEIADVWEEYWFKSKVKGTEKGFADRLRERAKNTTQRTSL